MKADYNMMAGQADQADRYNRRNLDIGAYFESFVHVKIGSEPESVGVSKKNYGGYPNPGYM